MKSQVGERSGLTDRKGMGPIHLRTMFPIYDIDILNLNVLSI